MIERDAAKLGEIARADPDREAPLVHGFGRNVSNPQIDDLLAISVRIQTAHRFAKDFRDAVTTVRFGIDGMIDCLVTPVKADHMIRTGPDDAFDTAKPRRFEDVPHTDYIGAKDRLPGRFTRAATEMQDTVDAFSRGANCIEIVEVGLHEALPFAEGINGLAIREPQCVLPFEFPRRYVPIPPAAPVKRMVFIVRSPLGECANRERFIMKRLLEVGSISS